MKEKETDLNLLRRIEKNPNYTQRKLSSDMVISLGKVNYCLRRLTEKGWVKVYNFHNSKNKRAYVYLLTPKGIEEKARLTYHFLQRKIDEYDQLKKEITHLKNEFDKGKGNDSFR
jgi:EPS-associated MarR family transcriptional regulator